MCTSKMDVTAVHLLPECYRGSSPRSASTPGPAPDSPASASGRFSASPLLSPCFSYYSHLHGTNTLGLMGLGASFLSSNPALLTPYSLGLGLPASTLLHNAMLPGLSSPPTAALALNSLNLQRQQHHSASQNSPTSRALPFSVENILKPEFGKNNGGGGGSVTHNSPDEDKKNESAAVHPTHSPNIPVTTAANKDKIQSVKRPLEGSVSKSDYKIQCTEEKQRSSSPTIPTQQDQQTTSQHAVDLTKNDLHQENNINNKNNTELPTDPLKMADPSKWPAWIFCTRYSDRPSSGPRSRRIKKDRKVEEKRPRTAFTAEQLARLKTEFHENRYLNEKRRQDLARELHLHENQIKIWFQNKRAKIKKANGQKNPLALQLMAQGLYNHSTVPVDEDEDEDYPKQDERDE